MTTHPRLEIDEHLSLCEALDRVLHKGVMVQGDIMISVADIDLIYLGLRLFLSSVETARKAGIIFASFQGGAQAEERVAQSK